MAIRNALLGLMLATLLGPISLSHAAGSYDVLELPAAPSFAAAHAPLFVIKKFGDRYFAAGDRGHIIYSDDDGKTWTQAQVPVRSTLLDLTFVNDQGWAVGHEGVILHSADFGKTWELQYDGLRYGEEGLAYYEARAAADPDNELYDYMIGEMDFAIEQGADKPFFGVNMYDEKHGHVAGAYGMLLVTFDGGKTWEHRLHNVDNEYFNHIFDFAPLPGEGRFFLTGEAGLLLIGDINSEQAERVHSVPWEGSFFATVAANDGAIIMGGLRGRMFRTATEGETWTVIKKPDTSAIVAAAKSADGTLIAAGVAGEILVSTDEGLSFTMDPASGSVGPIFDIAEGAGDSLLVVGPRGVKSVTLAQ